MCEILYVRFSAIQLSLRGDQERKAREQRAKDQENHWTVMDSAGLPSALCDLASAFLWFFRETLRIASESVLRKL
jgi:hypothetical protein